MFHGGFEMQEDEIEYGVFHEDTATFSLVLERGDDGKWRVLLEQFSPGNGTWNTAIGMAEAKGKR